MLASLDQSISLPRPSTLSISRFLVHPLHISGGAPSSFPLSAFYLASVMADEKASPLAALGDNALLTALGDFYSGFAKRREDLGLPYPGTVENISREVQRDVLLSNMMFSGLRADVQKVFSINPLFRIQHGLAMGSQALPPYTMTALFGTNKVRHLAFYVVVFRSC